MRDVDNMGRSFYMFYSKMKNRNCMGKFYQHINTLPPLRMKPIKCSMTSHSSSQLLTLSSIYSSWLVVDNELKNIDVYNRESC